MSDASKQSFKFFPMVEKLESILGSETDVMALISLIDKKKFLQLRADIIDFFDAGVDTKFTGKFGHEVEFGDISDAVRNTTFELYPQSTDMLKNISFEERKIWCEKIIERMDASAKFF